MSERFPVPCTPGSQATRVALLALSGATGLAVGAAALAYIYGVPGLPFGMDAVTAPRPVPVVVAVSPAPRAALMQPLPVPLPGRQVVARRSADGQFYFDTNVDGIGVRMMFDTGASVVALRSEDAARAGVDMTALRWTITTQTANGKGQAAPVVIASLRIGDIMHRNVAAMVLPPGRLNVSLLGQTFMSRLAGYRYEGGELILQAD